MCRLLKGQGQEIRMACKRYGIMVLLVSLPDISINFVNCSFEHVIKNSSEIQNLDEYRTVLKIFLNV